MSSVQVAHGEFDFQEGRVEPHPRDLRDRFIVQLEHGMIAFHFEVVTVVRVLGELETTQHELLCEIDHNGHILFGDGRRINDPRALNRHFEFIGKIWRLNDAT